MVSIAARYRDMASSSISGERRSSATRVLASGDYSARVITETRGEVGELARNFNDMAAELQHDIRPGFSGKARIVIGSRPLFRVISRKFIHFLRVHFLV